MCVTTWFQSIALKCKSGMWVFLPTNSVHVLSHSLCNMSSVYHSIIQKIKVKKCLCCLISHEVNFHFLICFWHWLYCLLVIFSPLCVRQRWRYAVSAPREPPWWKPCAKCRIVTSFTFFSLPVSADWWFPILGQDKILLFSPSISLY